LFVDGELLVVGEEVVRAEDRGGVEGRRRVEWRAERG
jgi:hypothetical protein